MRRREFIALVGGAAAAWPLAAQPQQMRLKTIGILMQGGPHHAGVMGLRDGLKAAGLQEGEKINLLVRDGKGDLTAVESAARDLEREGVDVVVAFSTSVTLAAKRSTGTVPIVFALGSDPVQFGLVDSIAKPGGRLTGVHSIIADLTAKRLELLQQIMPALKRVLTIYNPDNSVAKLSLEATRAAARVVSVEVVERPARSLDELRETIRALRGGDADALFFINDASVFPLDQLMVDTATSLRIATMTTELDVVGRGALAGYGPSYRGLGRMSARYVTRILSGAHPTDLPVEAVRPALAINLRTAKALGLTISPPLLARADEVIE